MKQRVNGRTFNRPSGQRLEVVEVDNLAASRRLKVDGSHQVANLDAAIEALRRAHQSGVRCPVLISDNQVLAQLADKRHQRAADHHAPLWDQYDALVAKVGAPVWQRTDGSII